MGMGLIGSEAATRMIGTVSHGTLRSEDLGCAFLSFLDALGEEVAHYASRVLVPASKSDCRAASLERLQITLLAFWNGRKDDIIGEWERESEKEKPNPELLSEMVSEMMDLASEALPEGFYFGNTEGDGSDFGVWMCDPS